MMCYASAPACLTIANLACGARHLLASGLDLLVNGVGVVLTKTVCAPRRTARRENEAAAALAQLVKSAQMPVSIDTVLWEVDELG